MKDQEKTKEDLIDELKNLRRRLEELEESEAGLKETERLLKQSEERFRLLYENAPLAYQSIDANGRFMEVNQAWLDMLGYSRDKVIGKWCGAFLLPAYQDKFASYFPQFKTAGEVHGVEFEVVKKDGSQRLIAADGELGRDRQEQFKQTHCIFHDVTERKRMEQALNVREQEDPDSG